MTTLTTVEKRMLEVLNETSINDLFSESGFDLYTDESESEYSDEQHPLMFNTENEKLFFLGYGTPNDGWVKTAEQQNPWIFICYLTAQDVENGADDCVERCILNAF